MTTFHHFFRKVLSLLQSTSKVKLPNLLEDYRENKVVRFSQELHHASKSSGLCDWTEDKSVLYNSDYFNHKSHLASPKAGFTWVIFWREYCSLALKFSGVNFAEISSLQRVTPSSQCGEFVWRIGFHGKCVTIASQSPM